MSVKSFVKGILTGGRSNYDERLHALELAIGRIERRQYRAAEAAPSAQLPQGFYHPAYPYLVQFPWGTPEAPVPPVEEVGSGG